MSVSEHQSDIDASTARPHTYEAGLDLTDLGMDGYEFLQNRLAISGIDIGNLEADRRYDRDRHREYTYYTVLSDCGTARITFQHDPHDRADESDYVGYVGISGTTREAVNTVVEKMVSTASYVKGLDLDRAGYIHP